MNCPLPRLVVPIGVCIVAAAGCGGTQNSRFYLLSPLPSPESAPAVSTDAQGLAIGIASIDLPEYTDRPQIASRMSPNRLHLAEWDRWAEPLKENFARVLAKNLAALLSTDRVHVFPWKASTPIDYRITVEVHRFEGTLGQDASLSARWAVLDKTGKKAHVVKQSTFTEPTGARGFEPMVAAQSRTLGALSREIAEAIEAIR